MLAVLRTLLLLIGLTLGSLVFAQSDDYQEASKLFRAGQYSQAMDRVDAVFRSNPKDARARFLKGLIFTEQNKPGDAIKVFTGLTEDYPKLPEPYNNLAVLYASQGQHDRARTALEMAIRTHPSYATAHENLGDIYAKMASQAYDKALQLDKGNATAQIKLGLIKELFSSNKPPAGHSEAISRTSTAALVKPVPPPVATPPAPVAATSAPPPAPAAPPPGAKPNAKPVAGDSFADVIKAVNNWARAWSGNDVNGYLAFYAPSFETPAGQPRADWEASRKLRIAKPRKIEVSVESPKVNFTDSTRATVTFRQNYRSPGLKVAGTKTLVMVKAGERWMIQQERVGS